MKHRPDRIRAMRPHLRRTPSGWLAVSPPSSVINVGMVGATRRDAKAAFAVEIEAWAALARHRWGTVAHKLG
jgi:hypothetical protein